MKGKKITAVILAILIIVFNVTGNIVEVRAENVNPNKVFNSAGCVITYSLNETWGGDIMLILTCITLRM